MANLYVAVPLFQQHRTGIDLHSKQYVWLLAQILTFVELWLARELVRGEVQITIRCNGERVRPENPWIVNDCFPLAVRLQLANAVVLVVAGVNSPLIVALKAIRSTLFTHVNHRLRDGLAVVGGIQEKFGRNGI